MSCRACSFVRTKVIIMDIMTTADKISPGDLIDIGNNNYDFVKKVDRYSHKIVITYSSNGEFGYDYSYFLPVFYDETIKSKKGRSIKNRPV